MNKKNMNEAEICGRLHHTFYIEGKVGPAPDPAGIHLYRRPG